MAIKGDGHKRRRHDEDAVEEAAEQDPQFAAAIDRALDELERLRDGAPSVAGIDLRHAKGVQVGNFNTQTNTFS
jgi:hypothetical protein